MNKNSCHQKSVIEKKLKILKSFAFFIEGVDKRQPFRNSEFFYLELKIQLEFQKFFLIKRHRPGLVNIFRVMKIFLDAIFRPHLLNRPDGNLEIKNNQAKSWKLKKVLFWYTYVLYQTNDF